MIVYRDPSVKSSTLLRYFCVAFWCSLIGTIAETATIFGLYGSLYSRWTVTMKVLIPVLHCIFTAAQLWGEKCTWDLWQQEKTKAKRANTGVTDFATFDENKASLKMEGKQTKIIDNTDTVEV
jgi:hypothetical protein